MASNGSAVGAPQFAFAHVYDPKLQAGRGEEFSAAHQAERTQAAMHEAWEAGDDFQLPMNRVEDALDTEGLQQASLEAPIPASNRGYEMLQRMGWSAGKGLGAGEDGIVEPVRGGMEAGLRLGLGKAEQEQFYISADNVTRKRLEVEVQADEDYERTLKREMAVERDQRIKDDTSGAKRNLYCDTCHKQYSNAMEMETHLSSYDHHHTKRLQEMRQATAERTRSERERKERRRAEKEWAKLNAQASRAQQVQGSGGSAHPAAPPVPPPPPPDSGEPPLPPLPPSAGAGSWHPAEPPGSWQTAIPAAQPQVPGFGWQQQPAGGQAAPAAAPPPHPPPQAGWQQQPQQPHSWQTASAAAPQPAGWQNPSGPGSAEASRGQASGVGSGGGLRPAGALAFGAKANLATKRPGFGAAVTKRQVTLKPAVAGFGLDDSDEEDGS